MVLKDDWVGRGRLWGCEWGVVLGLVVESWVESVWGGGWSVGVGFVRVCFGWLVFVFVCCFGVLCVVVVGGGCIWEVCCLCFCGGLLCGWLR